MMGGFKGRDRIQLSLEPGVLLCLQEFIPFTPPCWGRFSLELAFHNGLIVFNGQEIPIVGITLQSIRFA